MSQEKHGMTNSHLLVHRFGYVRPTSLPEITAALREHPDAAILAGGTNLLVDLKLERVHPTNVIDVTFVPELRGVEERSDGLWIGALTPIYALATSELLWKEYTALAEAAAAFGSTQIMMRGTLGGNVCNGSPASDTVPALVAFGADAYLVGPDSERMVPVGDLLEGPGKVRLRKGEILAAIRLPRATGQTGSAFLKLSRVRADLAKVSVAVRLSRGEDGRCTSARIELGSVGPTVVRAREAEKLLIGRTPTEDVAFDVGCAASAEIQPIDDVRSSATYRTRAAVALVHDACVLAWSRTSEEVKREQAAAEAAAVPRGEAEEPLRLAVEPIQLGPDEKATIRLTVNGTRHELDVRPNELLLNVLRERLELTGTKYGCGIGECGACTIWLNGTPVLGCLVLAVSADGAEVRTIEGLAAPNGTLDPLQEAFIEENAFQCGFCTPGMLMMTKKLLEEIPEPTEDEIRDYLKGNHCRCTGYSSIVRAVLRAANNRASLGPKAPVEPSAGGSNSEAP